MSIVITICGGLGNQLFQLFTAYALGLRTQRPVYVKNTCTNREFANKIVFSVNTTLPEKPYRVVHEEREFQVGSLPESGDICLHGYFQCSKYFDDLYPKIVPALGIRFPPERYPGTVLHVRKTDYVTYSTIYVQLPKRYYMNCKAFPAPYSIVTDDKTHPFVLDLAKDLHATIVQRDTYTDFWYLYGHEYIVCANSTFSWWASYFAQKEHNATVLRPDIYLTNGSTIE